MCPYDCGYVCANVYIRTCMRTYMRTCLRAHECMRVRTRGRMCKGAHM